MHAIVNDLIHVKINIINDIQLFIENCDQDKI